MHSAASAFEPGATFENRYEIVTKVGEGGFGTVYKARQHTTGQAVALKIMRLPEGSDAIRSQKRTARFLREARLCAQLHHPNVVPLIDCGQTGDGLLYTVFSFAPGETLADVLAREGALGLRETRHLMLQVLDALACAHGQGVIHRDIKPRNIMVIPTGARRNAVVLDFGIGVIMGDTSVEPNASRITSTNEPLGTPGYAAPEQLRGLEPSPRTDLYAWGLVFLECLIGKPVFSAHSAAAIIYAQLRDDPVPLPVGLADHPFGDFLRRTTLKDVTERNVTAQQLHDALDAFEFRHLSRQTTSGASSIASGKNSSDVSDALASTGETNASLSADRRQITAVCCAFRIFSQTPKVLDIEELDELSRIAVAICLRYARHHGGHVAGALGDEALFYFGYPHASEYDAHRAARAALAIADAIRSENDKLAMRGVRIDMQIGIHTGVVVVGKMDQESGPDLSIGATPSLAAKLAARVRPGCIEVTADTQRLLRSRFAVTTEETRSLDGFVEPVKVFRLEGIQASQPPTPTYEERRTPLIGRDQEMDLLAERWRRTRAGGGQCSLLTGEPGLGKSRLAAEMQYRVQAQARAAAEPHVYFECRCAPDMQNNALYPLLEPLGRLLGLDQVSSHKSNVAQLESQLGRHEFTIADVMPLFLPLFSLPIEAPYAPLEVSPRRLKVLTLNAIASLLFAVAEERPALLLFEDLHWADPTTIELLTQLVDEAPSVPIFLLMTARPEFSPTFKTTGMLQLHLSRLEQPHIERMVAELLHGKALPPAVLEQIVERTDGVPLFVEELTQMLIESGSLVEHEDRYEAARPTFELEIPSTLRGLLMTRLDRLGSAKDTAQIAAAIGREFSLDLLRAVVSIDQTALTGDLDKLVAADLVHRKRRLKNPTYVFKHALVQDTAYDSMVKSRRREIHERIARTLKGEFPNAVEEQPAVLAWHFERAGLEQDASDYILRAGQHAMQRSAFVEATAVLSRGIEFTTRSDDGSWAARRELELRAVLGGALVSSKGYATPDFENNGLRARELCETLENPPELFMVDFSLWLLNVVRGDRLKAEHFALELTAIAEKSGNPDALLSAYHARGVTCYYSQRGDEASQWLRRAITHYDPAKHLHLTRNFGDDHGIYALAYLQHVEILRGDIAEALDLVNRTRELAANLRDPLASAEAALFALSAYHLLGDDERMATETEVVVHLATKHGFFHWDMLGRIAHGLVCVRRGEDAEAAMQQMHMGLGYLQMNNQWTARPYWTLCLVEVLWRLGRLDEAIELVDNAMMGAKGKLDQGSVPMLIRWKGVIRAQQGHRDAAMVAFREALDLAHEQSDRVAALWIARDLARILIDVGQNDEARALLSAALAHIRGGVGWSVYDECVKLMGGTAVG